MKKHLIKRFAFFLLGVVLFYAPFALVVRLIGYGAGSHLVADCHRTCMRMPIVWLFQPWMYKTMVQQPAYLFVVAVLPAVALFAGPLFCGWLCPAGAIPELFGRIVPDKLKLGPVKSLPAHSVRYGVLAGMVVAAFLGANTCCAFCNFGHTQSLIKAAGFDFSGLTHWASFTALTFFVWFFVGGIFTRGGRGWCNYLCPAGALQGFFTWIGLKAGFAKTAAVDEELCTGCGCCTKVCSSWAVECNGRSQINPHSCNQCLDCVAACPQKAISYKKANSRNGSHR